MTRELALLSAYALGLCMHAETGGVGSGEGGEGERDGEQKE